MLRRAGVEVLTVGNELVKGSRGISVASDMGVKDFLENMSFEHQVSLYTKDYKDKLIYSEVPPCYVYDFVSHKYHHLMQLLYP